MIDLVPLLSQLEKADLIKVAAADPELAYLFRHGLIQDAANATLLRGQRRRWHLATAEVLEAAYAAGSSAATMPAILANHFQIAGDERRAIKYLVLAADSAFEGYANSEAIDFYTQAQAGLARTWRASSSDYDPALVRHIYLRRGRALELTSQLAAALDNYVALEAIARDHADQALELAGVMARATIHATANNLQNVQRAEALLEHARVLAHDLNDQAVEANISWTQLLNNTMSGGDVAQRLRYGERALTLARELGQRELMALTLNDIWYAYAGSGQWDRALAALDEGRPIARELGNLAVLCENIGRSAISHLVSGDYPGALDCIEQAYQVAETSHSTDLRALSRAFAGMIHTERGDFDRAIAISEDAIALGETTTNVTVLILTQADLGRTYALLGAVDQGLALARQALDASRGFDLLAPMPKAILVRLHVMSGHLDQAEAALLQLGNYHEIRRQIGFLPFVWGNMVLAEIEVALARNDAIHAQSLADELIELFEQDGIHFLLPEAMLLRGRALQMAGQQEAARAALQLASDCAIKIGSRRLQWPIYSALAQVASQRGMPAAAQTLREQARQVIDYIAAHAPRAELRASFLALPEIVQLNR